MASSKVMTSSSSSSLANPDTPRDSSSLYALMADLHDPKTQTTAANATITMDDLLKNIYSDNTSTPDPSVFPKSADDVWKEIVAGTASGGSSFGAGLSLAGDVKGEDYQGITLEDFLSRNPVGQEGVGAVGGVNGSFVNPHPPPLPLPLPQQGQVVAVSGARGKRRAVQEEPPVDKATQQKQRRMIKNRESAARSRERKQAYTAELEALVTQLEEEKAQLLKEQAGHNKERFKQLIENLIPVEEGQRPPRTLRKVQSNRW